MADAEAWCTRNVSDNSAHNYRVQLATLMAATAAADGATAQQPCDGAVMLRQFELTVMIVVYVCGVKILYVGLMHIYVCARICN
jgi:hypothetical protein